MEGMPYNMHSIGDEIASVRGACVFVCLSHLVLRLALHTHECTHHECARISQQGNGLGGGSLVNSNVSIKPDARVYNAWPSSIRHDMKTLEECFSRCEEVLCPMPYPGMCTCSCKYVCMYVCVCMYMYMYVCIEQKTHPLTKAKVFQQVSKEMGAQKSYLANVNVSFNARVNAQGGMCMCMCMCMCVM